MKKSAAPAITPPSASRQMGIWPFMCVFIPMLTDDPWNYFKASKKDHGRGSSPCWHRSRKRSFMAARSSVLMDFQRARHGALCFGTPPVLPREPPKRTRQSTNSPKAFQ